MSEWKETDIGPIPSDWDIITVADVIQDKGIAVGVMYPGEDTVGGIPMIRVADIKGGKINTSTGYHISPSVNEQHKRTILNGGEVIVTLVGNPGTTVVVRDEFKGWNVARAIGVMKLKDPSEGKYLSYALHSPNSKFLIDSFLNTTVQPTLNLGELKLVQIPWPNKSIRISIAEALNSLDDKIDLLLRNNKTLEQLAETLFRQWFIEEAEDSWEEITLGEISEITRGLSYKGSGLTEINDINSVPMVNLNSIKEGGGFKYEGLKYYKGEYKERHTLNDDDIVIINTDITQDNRVIGWASLIPTYLKKSIFSHHIYRLRIKSNFFSKYFLLYFLNSDSNRDILVGSTNGTTVSMLPIDAVQKLCIKIPPKNKVDLFDEQASFIFEKKENNNMQIQQLETLRDTLLPKLMSGMVRVEI
jgi:type I restriction enzyme S subunit